MAISKKPLTARVRVAAKGRGKKFGFVQTPLVAPIRRKVRANGKEYLTIAGSDVLTRGARRTAEASARMQRRLADAFKKGRLSKEEYLRLREKIESKANRLHDLIHRQTTRLAERDPMLSMLYNKAKFFSVLGEWIKERKGKPLTYIILDVDFFKKINDEHGHLAGDIALKFFAQAVNKVSKQFKGFAGRYGGEEITVAIPRDERHARTFALMLNRELVASFQREEVVRSTLKGKLFTFSAGAHQVKKGEDTRTLAEMADKKLYQAKKAGRDMVVYSIDMAKSNVTLAHSIRQHRVV
ncbi:MAG: GGDEF domain-containing protein [Candidatus Iainarchaeum archaeon]|uniref:GGDEF domain-containing protein n=1 Tax=Candidatus Iainarchaeum sp. TaxID=3101447 RepID=A0A7T9I1K4_9ARCH|nr:MAG: GGDEF domain-containing protein [Candidatus Diapherotrites archaeon]